MNKIKVGHQEEAIRKLLGTKSHLEYYHKNYQWLQKNLPEIAKKLKTPMPKEQRIRLLKQVNDKLTKLGYHFDPEGTFTIL